MNLMEAAPKPGCATEGVGTDASGREDALCILGVNLAYLGADV